MPENLVSIIVPVFNGEKYLRGCIDSLISQTYKDIEVIIIDDGSTDSSGQICQEYAKKDSRVKLTSTRNNGPAQARNIGIAQAKGEFIFFIDADDIIRNDGLSLLIEGYRRYQADLTIANANGIKENIPGPGYKGVFSEDRVLAKRDILDYARYYLRKPNKFTLFAYSWGRLFKSSIIKDKHIFFNPELRTFEDVAFNFDYLNYVDKVSFLKEAVYSHRIYDNYMSATMSVSDNPEILFGYRRALASIGDFLNKSNSGIDVKKDQGHAFICLTIIQLVRACGQINSKNKEKIRALVKMLVNERKLRENLKFYSPSKGDSRILPLLMKLKLVSLIISVCRYKADKRYKKSRS